MQTAKTKKSSLRPPKWQDNIRRAPTQERALKTIDTIFKAAIEVLRENDEDAFSTNKVAQRAGLSIGAVYQYFSTKEEIVWGLAQRGQARVREKIDRYLTALESNSDISTQGHTDIIEGLVAILVESFAKGKPGGVETSVSRKVIRYAWRCEKFDEMAKFAADLTVRITIFIENIKHPLLPARSSTQYFVITRAILGVLRYASLEKTSLLNTNALEDSLSLMFLGLFTSIHQEDGRVIAETEYTYHQNSRTQAEESDIQEQVEQFQFAENHVPPSLRLKIAQKRSRHTIGIIFKTLMKLLGVEGSSDFTTNKLASHSGFSIGAIYKYFPNKEKLLWMAVMYGAFFLQKKVNSYLEELEKNPAATGAADPRIPMIEATKIYVDAFCKGSGFSGSEYFSSRLVRLAWLWEHSDDTIFLAQQTDCRLMAFWERVQHPQMPGGIPYPHLYVASRGVISVFRSASLESPDLLDSQAVAGALLHISVIMGVSQVNA